MMSCLNLYGNTEEFFDYFFKTLKDNINRWNYFVNWNKVRENLRKIEKELHLLDYLIGKENLEDELKSNIFLRCDQNDLKIKLNMKNQEDLKVFKKVRDLKDSF